MSLTMSTNEPNDTKHTTRFEEDTKDIHDKITDPDNRDFVMSRTSMEMLKKRNFTFFDGEDFIARYNNSAMKGFDIVQFDMDLTRLLETHNIKINEKKLSWNYSDMANLFGQKGLTGNLKLRYRGTKGDELFAMTRTFNLDGDAHSVIHELLTIPRSIRAKGVAKEILNLSYGYYRKIGIERIELFANLDVGGYSWAKAGFNTTKKGAELVILKAKREHWVSLQEYIDAERIITSHFRKNQYSQVFPMRLLAQESYGKRMLLGSGWDGFLDLTDKNQLEIFLNYLKVA
jgi:hypothetical protein